MNELKKWMQATGIALLICAVFALMVFIFYKFPWVMLGLFVLAFLTGLIYAIKTTLDKI